MSVPALETATGMRRGRLEALLKILAVDGAVARRAGRVDRHRRAAGRVRRREVGGDAGGAQAEADLMRRYAAGRGCLMEFLQQALDDPDPAPCGRCSVCTGELPRPGALPSRERARRGARHLRGVDIVLEPRKRWPTGLPVGARGDRRCDQPGRALAYRRRPGWADTLSALDRLDGPLDDVVAAHVAALLTRWSAPLGRAAGRGRCGAVTSAPPTGCSPRRAMSQPCSG